MHFLKLPNYNDIWENKSGDYYGCTQGANDISNDPEFVNAPFNDDSGNNPYFNNVDLHLQNTSPCIDAGTTISSVTTDADGNQRPAGSGYDMGAYENSEPNKILESELNELFLYPNPANKSIFISEKFLNKKYQLFSAFGTIVKQGIVITNKIDLSQLKTGIYYLKIEDNKFMKTKTGKIIIVKK